MDDENKSFIVNCSKCNELGPADAKITNDYKFEKDAYG